MSLIEIMQGLSHRAPALNTVAPAQTWWEKLLTDWQAGAGAPQPQSFEPRAYPPRPGTLPLGRSY